MGPEDWNFLIPHLPLHLLEREDSRNRSEVLMVIERPFLMDFKGRQI